ncbi:MAG: glycosyltransferase [Candidatus Sumerlaeia bacterium]|nr:glycosyltransferase [Candidatus Sumerlaeia bacterium]
MSQKLSIIIPVYNESPTIEEVVERVRKAPLPDGFEREIILVDDGSTDGAHRVYKHLGPEIDHLVINEDNLGKGASIRRGLEKATGDFVIVQDADLEYDPGEYIKLLRPILDGKADVVYGSRFMTSSARRVLYFWHALANRILTNLSNVLTNLNLTDMQTCYKMFRRSDLMEMDLQANGFGFEAEVTTRIAHKRLRVYEVSIGYAGRTYSEGKKIGFLDSLHCVWCLIRFSLFYKPDDVGRKTLERLESYAGYSRLILDQFRPHMGDRVLEFGSGMGSIGRLILDRERVVLTDYNEDYVAELKKQFGRLRHVSIHRMDITSPPAELIEETFDTVISSNVLEHIKDDMAALKGVYNLLQPGGRLVILVPAFNTLYSPLDKNLEHYRRYTKRMMTRRLREVGFEVEESWYWNMVGAVGWYVAGRVFRQQTITDFNIILHRFIEPISRLVDSIAGKSRPFGLSLITIARKPDEDHANSG